MNIFQKQIKVLATVAILGITSNLSANDLADSLKKNNLYVGFQSSWPSYGISAKMDIKEKVAIQGVIGLLGTVNSYSVRGIYKFKQKQFYNLYGFGSVGLWTWDGGRYYGSESVFGIGGGAGVEYDLRGIDRSFIPLFVNAEIDITIASFDNYSFSSTGLGLGLHYKF